MVSRKLLEVELENYTPLMYGGASSGWINIDGSIDYPRPTDLAGKVRWWLRSILSAAIYERYNVFLPISALDEIVEVLMGYSRGGFQQASRIVFKLSPVENQEYSFIRTANEIKSKYYEQLCRLYHKYNEKWLEVHRACLRRLVASNGECSEGDEVCCALASPRVLLSVMGKKPDEALGLIPLPPGSVRLKLIVMDRTGRELDEPTQRLLGATLALATTVFGLGKAVTRGYGKLAPINYSGGSTPLSETYQEIVEEILYYGNLLRVVERTVNYAKEFIAVAKYQGKCVRDKIVSTIRNATQKQEINTNVPYAYTLHKEYIVVWNSPCVKLVTTPLYPNVSSITCDVNKLWCMIAAINIAVQKATLKYLIATTNEAIIFPGESIKTLHLGLPRSSAINNVKIGYYIDGKEGRLMSPLVYTNTKYYIYSLLFMSIVPEILISRYKYFSKKSEKAMSKAKSLALNIFLSNYFSRKGFSMNDYMLYGTIQLYYISSMVNDALGLRLIYRGGFV